MENVVNVKPVIGPSILKLYKELEVGCSNHKCPRFKLLSFKIVYCLLMLVSQTLVAMVNVWIMFETNVSVTSVGHLSFYVSGAVTTIIFFQVAKRWPQLLRKIPHYRLDEYIDSRLKAKCNLFITIFLTLAIVEHVLAEFVGVTAVLNCAADYTRLYRDYIEMSFPWVAEFGLPDHFLVGISIQFINITATLSWNYSDIFIVCISYYLTSVLEGIHRKLVDNKTKYLSTHFWRSAREDYNHAAKLVRAFDEVVSGAVFVSFTINLFFICFQLYNLLSLRTGWGRSREFMHKCGWRESPACECGAAVQDMDHIIRECPLTKYQGNPADLFTLDNNVTQWIQQLGVLL